MIICPDCDLIFEKSSVVTRHSGYCSRCNAQLYRGQVNPVNKLFAYSLAGLLFWIPANTLPVMTFSMFSMASTNTMFNGVQKLYEGGYWWMAFLVLMCSVVAPLINLSFLLFIASCLKFNKFSKIAKSLLIWQHKIQEWGMPEVYMIGILIAYIKMIELGDILVEVGMFCFIGMLISTVAAGACFDRQDAFEHLDQNRSVSNNQRLSI